MLQTRRVFLLTGLAAAGLLSACVGGTFRTSFARPVPAATAAGWRLAGVRVAVPESLTVSEQKSYLPRADIVWREDPPGDRRAQVAAILKAAATRGASGLRGSRPVILELTVSRFHALTFEAELRFEEAGVHNIIFTARVLDAAGGAVLYGPEEIEASLPALSGAQMRAARARGETQKSQISAHVAATIAGWLGLGPDPRGTFARSGG
jgi:hypothetical protein